MGGVLVLSYCLHGSVTWFTCLSQPPPSPTVYGPGCHTIGTCTLPHSPPPTFEGCLKWGQNAPRTITQSLASIGEEQGPG